MPIPEATVVEPAPPKKTLGAHWYPQSGVGPTIVDVNGDGRADLLVRHVNGLMVWLGTGGGGFEATLFAREGADRREAVRSYGFPPAPGASGRGLIAIFAFGVPAQP